MVCVPCIVIPVLLWVFHKWIQPFILKFWNPWSKSEEKKTDFDEKLLLESASGTYIHEMITNHPVVIFSKTTCSFCAMAKEVFDKKSVSYKLQHIDERDDCQLVQDLLEKMSGARTVPRVFVGGKCIGGGSETYSLDNQGRLDDMLKNAGVKLEDKKTQ